MNAKSPVPLAAQISALEAMLDALRAGKVLSKQQRENLIEELDAALATMKLFERHELDVRLAIRRAEAPGS